MEVLITAKLAGKTVGHLAKRELQLSTTLLNRLKRRETGLLLNGKRVFTSAVVREGDILTLDLTDPPSETPTAPIPLPLSIVYEDEHLLVVDKSAPLAVHASSFAPTEPTLANALAAYWGPYRPFHPVNRLDRGTTGLMAVAKNSYIHERLQKALHSAAFHRTYLAVVVGDTLPDAGEITSPIGRAEGSPIKRCVRPDGTPAKTVYHVLERQNGFSLVHLTPHTGRTHQLRVHMASLGYPLAGDWLYGTEDRNLIPRPALHSAAMALTHPVTGEPLTLTAPLPVDMAALLR